MWVRVKVGRTSEPLDSFNFYQMPKLRSFFFFRGKSCFIIFKRKTEFASRSNDFYKRILLYQIYNFSITTKTSVLSEEIKQYTTHIPTLLKRFLDKTLLLMVILSDEADNTTGWWPPNTASILE